MLNNRSPPTTLTSLTTLGEGSASLSDPSPQSLLCSVRLGLHGGLWNDSEVPGNAALEWG